MGAPRAFLSHASEDKDRFVIAFATRLRELGIDVWLDKWEIHPGDSLVRKIFDEGLQGAAAVIVVVSSNSVNKPWVREEIDAGFVGRIERHTRLIPVIIDKCDVPAPLQHLLWVSIKDLNRYESELESIVNAIYGKTERPPLGPAPQFNSYAIPVPQLDPADAAIFRLIYDGIIATNSTILNYDHIRTAAEQLSISGDAVTESLQILANRTLIKTIGTFGLRVAMVQPTPMGFETYLSATRSDYQLLVRLIGAQIVNDGMRGASQIAKRLNEPLRVIEHVINTFSAQGWLSRVQTMADTHIISTSPDLKRFLRG